MWAALEATMARQIRRLTPIARATADPATRAVAAQIERDFGAYVPPFALHAAVPSLLAASWTMLREALVTTHVDRVRKEVVATAVSRANACSYCVDAHGAALHALGSAAAADGLTGTTPACSLDPTLAPLAAWAAATGSAGDHPACARPPFAAAEAPELVAIAAGFHYVNRMVTLFLAPSPMPVASPRLKAWLRRALGPILRGPLGRPLAPGASLDLLPAAPLPDDLQWTRGVPAIADAFARAAAAFEAAGAAHVPAPVRDVLRRRVGAWRGEAPPLGRHWLDAAVGDLAAEHGAAARLALLAALAPHQVDDGLLADCRRAGAGDAALVALAGWASFTAARRIASWIAPRG